MNASTASTFNLDSFDDGSFQAPNTAYWTSLEPQNGQASAKATQTMNQTPFLEGYAQQQSTHDFSWQDATMHGGFAPSPAQQQQVENELAQLYPIANTAETSPNINVLFKLLGRDMSAVVSNPARFNDNTTRWLASPMVLNLFPSYSSVDDLRELLELTITNSINGLCPEYTKLAPEISSIEVRHLELGFVGVLWGNLPLQIITNENLNHVFGRLGATSSWSVLAARVRMKYWLYGQDGTRMSYNFGIADAESAAIDRRVLVKETKLAFAAALQLQYQALRRQEAQEAPKDQWRQQTLRNEQHQHHHHHRYQQQQQQFHETGFHVSDQPTPKDDFSRYPSNVDMYDNIGGSNVTSAQNNNSKEHQKGRREPGLRGDPW